MAVRCMQIFLPSGCEIDVESLLDGREVLGCWQDANDAKRRVVHLLVPADETEPIMDRLEAEFESVGQFHVVLFPVEAVLPRPVRPEDEVGEQQPGVAQEAQQALGNSGRVSREELVNDISETLETHRVYCAMTLLSAVVAAVGLIRNDVPVIIGAMVIAPLLGPNVAIALAVVLRDLTLLARAMKATLLGIALALLPSLLIGLVLPIDPQSPAIHARTEVNIGDLALALAAGSAGTFAVTRGLSTALIGVMVAVALVPPLATLGMLVGAGYLMPAFGAGLLVGANLVCIHVAGLVTFLAQGVRPRAEKA